MRLTRSQLILVIALGVLTVGIYGFLVSIVVRNSTQMSQVLISADSTSPSAVQAETPSPLPAFTATPTPIPTATPAPIVTPTSILPAPQTRYDLQVAREPENPTLRLQRGYAYIKLSAYTYAVEDFDVATHLDASLVEAYLGRGEARFYLKEWSAALDDFERALILNSDLADAHAWRGYLLSERGEYTLALEALRQAVALDSADPGKHIWLAQALLRSGNPGEAEAEYTMALLLNPRSVEAHVGRGMALAEQGNLEAAQADLLSGLDIAPYDPVALNGQAWLYAWYRQEYLAEAENLVQRAISGAEGDMEMARYLHTLGWIYYQWGRYEEAVAVLEEAAELATIEGEVVYEDILEHLEQASRRRSSSLRGQRLRRPCGRRSCCCSTPRHTWTLSPAATKSLRTSLGSCFADPNRFISSA